MRYMNLEIDQSKLMPMAEVVSYLKTHGERYGSLSDLRGRYEEEFGQDLVWNYLDCGYYYPGFFLMPVREGFLGIPYDAVSFDGFETLVADEVFLLSARELQTLLNDYRAYARGLMAALEDMISIQIEEESK